MKFIFFKLSQLASISLCLLPLFACAVPGHKLDGRVLDVATNKPLAGVIVIASWDGFQSMGIADGQTQCYHVDTTTTNEQGAYHFKEAPLSLLQDKHVTLQVYKPGYIRSPEYFKRESYRQGIELMEVFKGGAGDRLKYLSSLSESTRCAAAGDSIKNLRAFKKALYAEANGIASSHAEKEIVEGLHFQADIVEFGYEVAERQQIERYRGQK